MRIEVMGLGIGRDSDESDESSDDHKGECKCPALTTDEHALLRVVLANPQGVVGLLTAARAGQRKRTEMDEKKASADFMAEYERMEAATFRCNNLRDAWVAGFRTPIQPEKREG